MNLDSIFPIAIGLAVPGSVIAYFFWDQWQRKKWNEAQPVLTLPVQVVSKTRFFSEEDRAHPVVFQMPNGKSQTFYVPNELFLQMSKGTCGLLSFQGQYYKEFQFSAAPTLTQD